MTSLPDIVAIDRSEEDEFILLACDGVWEKYVSNSKKMVGLIGQLRGKYENGKVVLDKLFSELVAKDSK